MNYNLCSNYYALYNLRFIEMQEAINRYLNPVLISQETGKTYPPTKKFDTQQEEESFRRSITLWSILLGINIHE